jgi:hypothetical protein
MDVSDAPTLDFLKELHAKAVARKCADEQLGAPVMRIMVPKNLIQADGTLDMNKAREWCDEWLKKRFA